MPLKKHAAPSFVGLKGSQIQPLAGSRTAGQPDGSEVTSITVRVRPAEDPKTLEQKVNEIYAEPLESRKYLSREELTETHGARPEDLDAIEQYAHQHNLVVSHRSRAERSIVVTGKLTDLLAAFPADVQIAHHDSGTYRARRGEILIPKQFDGIITGIFGYDTRPKQRHVIEHVTTTAAGPGGVNGVAATDFAKRYNFPTDFQGVTLDGSGQTIAIIELGGGYNASDLQVYFREIKGTLPKVTSVSVDKGKNHPTKTGAADGEVMLDIEVAGAVAPKALIAVYFAPNTNKGFLDGINAAVHDTERKPSVVSISWGAPEDGVDQQSLQAYH